MHGHPRSSHTSIHHTHFLHHFYSLQADNTIAMHTFSLSPPFSPFHTITHDPHSPYPLYPTYPSSSPWSPFLLHTRHSIFGTSLCRWIPKVLENELREVVPLVHSRACVFLNLIMSVFMTVKQMKAWLRATSIKNTVLHSGFKLSMGKESLEYVALWASLLFFRGLVYAPDDTCFF